MKRGTASVVLSPKTRNAIKRLCSGKLPAKTIKNNKMQEIRTKINELYSKVEDMIRESQAARDACSYGKVHDPTGKVSLSPG